MAGENRADAKRLIAWLASPSRKPADLAFSAGPERQVADYVILAIREAERAAAARERERAAKAVCEGCRLAWPSHHEDGDWWHDLPAGSDGSITVCEAGPIRALGE